MASGRNPTVPPPELTQVKDAHPPPAEKGDIARLFGSRVAVPSFWLADGRRNWLHLGGDGALCPTAVLLSVTASVKRHGINPWEYLKHVLTELPARPAGADLTDLFPDACARAIRAST
jgi:hypothetical protein